MYSNGTKVGVRVEVVVFAGQFLPNHGRWGGGGGGGGRTIGDHGNRCLHFFRFGAFLRKHEVCVCVCWVCVWVWISVSVCVCVCVCD